MILKISGNVSKYYVQTLAMIFFPGEKFPENADSDEFPYAEVTVSADKSCVSSHVVILTSDSKVFSLFSLSGKDLSEAGDMAIKIAVGRAFLSAGAAATGIIPPWGILTGVRPAKVASSIIEKGSSESETEEKLCRIYRAYPRKAKLAVNVSASERRLITPESHSECSVYIAIPFCPSRCSYCSFVSYTSGRLLKLIPEYLKYLSADIKNTFEIIRSLGIRVSTVYIGGGTPTVLDECQLEFLLNAIADNCDVSKLDEFTLEAGRPDTINPGKLKMAKECGVTRISVNTQTLNESILASIGRKHTAADFFKAYDMAEKFGIPHINVDLIAGLPGESSDSFSDTVTSISALKPDNITVHTFCVKKSAQIRSDDASIYRREGSEAAAAVDNSQNILELGGYIPYYMYRQKNTIGNLENVGYALPGAEGLYNVYMMEEVHSIFAAGASSVTKLVSPVLGKDVQIKRIFENKYPYEYLREHSDGSYDEILQRKRKEIFDFYGSF